jgi:hypothetical protein
MNIKSFLSNPNRIFKDGLALYHDVKTSNEYDSFFSSHLNCVPGSLAFNILDKQLSRALRKTLSDNSVSSPGNTSKLPIAVKHISISRTPDNLSKNTNRLIDLPGVSNVDDLPENIKAAYFENKSLFTQLAGLRIQLSACETNEERQPIAESISNIHNLKESNWQLINRFLYGNLDSTSVPIAPDPVSEALKTERRIRTLKINISRAEKDLNSGLLKGKKLATRLESLRKWKQEMSDISHDNN